MVFLLLLVIFFNKTKFLGLCFESFVMSFLLCFSSQEKNNVFLVYFSFLIKFSVVCFVIPVSFGRYFSSVTIEMNVLFISLLSITLK